MSIEIPKLVPGDAVFCARPSVEWLHDAIMATAGAATLQPEDGVRDVLADHLSTLVQQYRKLFVSATPLPHLRAVEEKPWYPDDSGEWVELPDKLSTMPPELTVATRINVLTNSDRAGKKWTFVLIPAGHWNWTISAGAPGHIVAYKVIKP